MLVCLSTGSPDVSARAVHHGHHFAAPLLHHAPVVPHHAPVHHAVHAAPVVAHPPPASPCSCCSSSCPSPPRCPRCSSSCSPSPCFTMLLLFLIMPQSTTLSTLLQ